MMPFMRDRTLKELFSPQDVIDTKGGLSFTVIKHVDLAAIDSVFWKAATIDHTYFLGCAFGSGIEDVLRRRSAVIVPAFDGLPYEPFRTALYTIDELLQPFNGKTLDTAIYDDFIAKGKLHTDVIEAITRRLHDDSIDDGIDRLLRERNGMKIVGFMGGSAVSRADEWYAVAARTARLLARNKYLVVTGGGPGMMEAANLGAYLAGFPDEALDAALGTLSSAPMPSDSGYLERALELRRTFKDGGESLGIPTWFYGFEQTNAFAKHIAKYFENSIREAGLVAIGKDGVVFCPGSAGTRQEIFMAAAADHYATAGYVSPMVFLGRTAYELDTHIYQLVNEVASGRYKDMLFITDQPDEVLRFVASHPPHR